jgi:4-amino-4-deoxy-L-arabinose transferase-like glycosyltransferase
MTMLRQIGLVRALRKHLKTGPLVSVVLYANLVLLCLPWYGVVLKRSGTRPASNGVCRTVLIEIDETFWCSEIWHSGIYFIQYTLGFWA